MAKRTKRQNEKGFELVEVVLVMSMVSLVVAVSVPAYQDMTAKTRNDATKIALAQFRSALDRWESDRILAGTGDINNPPKLAWNGAGLIDDAENDPFYTGLGWPVSPKIMKDGDNPENPWISQKGCATQNTNQSDWVYALQTLSPGTVFGPTSSYCNYGWVYDLGTGKIWANSNVNGENAF